MGLEFKILIYKIAFCPCVRPSVRASAVHKRLGKGKKGQERARKSWKKRKEMERSVERKEFKILHVLPVRIKESKPISRPVILHILKITNSGKYKCFGRGKLSAGS